MESLARKIIFVLVFLLFCINTSFAQKQEYIKVVPCEESIDKDFNNFCKEEMLVPEEYLENYQILLNGLKSVGSMIDVATYIFVEEYGKVPSNLEELEEKGFMRYLPSFMGYRWSLICGDNNYCEAVYRSPYTSKMCEFVHENDREWSCEADTIMYKYRYKYDL